MLSFIMSAKRLLIILHNSWDWLQYDV